MKPKVMTQFGGIAPRYAPGLTFGMAQTAENCDLSSGKIKPLKGHLAVGAGMGNSLHYYEGEWYSGPDRYYVNWPIGADNLLLYLEDGVPMKRVGDSVAVLGQELPEAPTVETNDFTFDFSPDSEARCVLIASSVENEYYPGIVCNGRVFPVCVVMDEYDGGGYTLFSGCTFSLAGGVADEGVLGSLGHHEWAYGDQDGLGFDTLYLGFSGLTTEEVGWKQVVEFDDLGVDVIRVGYVQWGSSITDPMTTFRMQDGQADVALRHVSDTIYELVGVTDGTIDLYKTAHYLGISGPFAACYINDNPYTLGEYGDLAAGEWVFETGLSGFSPGILFVMESAALTTTAITGGDVAFFSDNGITQFSLSSSLGSIVDTVRYAITTVRSVGGHEDESGLGAVSEDIECDHIQTLVTRPEITDTDVTHWKLWRIGDSTGEYQLVATLDADTETYEDALDASEVGESPTTFYTSDQGNEILFSKPAVVFDGLAGVGNGMVFGWAGHILYWCEPGKPDAWPSYYTMNFPADIRDVIPMGGVIGVMTEIGAFRVDGTHPELLQPSDPIGLEPVRGLHSAKTSRGIAYLSDSGVGLFNLYETSIVSDTAFTESWFAEIDSESSVLIQSDNMLYLFHSDGVLKLDPTSGTASWSTLSLSGVTAAFIRPDTGGLFVLASGSVYEVSGGDGDLSWEWLSGDIYGDSDDQEFRSVSVVGSGSVTLAVYIDGDLIRSRGLDFTLDRGRTIQLRQEEAGRALWFKLTGTGIVTEVVVR